MGRKNKSLPLLDGIHITSVAAEGKSVARAKLSPDSEREFVIFIPYGAPGDVAEVQIDRKKHTFAEGHIVSLREESDERVSPVCQHFGVCGGCKWQHLDYKHQLKHKRQQVVDALERIAKVNFPEVKPTLGSRHEYEYRNKMEYTFSHKKWRTWEEIKAGKEFDDSPNALGFHISGAFDKVLHIEKCHLQINLGNEIRDCLYQYAEQEGLRFYNIKGNTGDLRTVMIRIASTGEVMVCVVFGDASEDVIEGVMRHLANRFPEITSLVYVVNTKANDTISDLTVHKFRGNDYIEEEMEGLKFSINAKSFYQTNSEQAYQLYKVARQYAGLDGRDESARSKIVYDLYTGAGTIANFVAPYAKKVVGIEYVPEAIEDAKLNSKVNNIDNTIFFAGDMKNVLTDSFVEEHGRPDIMIIDPPRAGMHEDVIKVIRNAAPEVIVYVSCNPSTQARDVALLDDMYMITDVQPVDMFPHTHHVENVIRMVRR